MNVPSATSGMRSFASFATITKSHERASSQPAPIACPFTAATTGCGSVWRARYTRCPLSM